MWIYVKISAIKQLIMINRIQNKSFSLHNICMCAVIIIIIIIIIITVYLLCIYKYTHI